MPTPEPMAVSVGIISNFLACEGQSVTDLNLDVEKYVNKRGVTYQWLHNDIYPDPKHFEKGSFWSRALQIIFRIPKKYT